jgi:ribonuclease VapC
MSAEIVPFTQEHYEAAVSAFLRYGKGRHPAGLNFGDCMSYALAVVSGLPLLYTGTDFSLTDVKTA